MLNSPLFEVAISLSLIYFLLALLTSGINEFVTSMLAKRGQVLRDALANILDDQSTKNWVSHIYDHPLIKSISKKKTSLPSYISPDTFVTVFSDLLMQNEDGKPVKRTFENVEKAVDGLEDGDLKTMLQTLLHNAENDINKFQKELKNWYDTLMDRVSGWYKKEINKIIFVISLIVCFSLNIDTFKITQTLWTNPQLRAAMVAAAEEQVRQNQALQSDSLFNAAANTDSLLQDIRMTYHDITALSLPIGWKGNEEIIQCSKKDDSWSIDWKNLFLKIGGLLFTSIAVHFGAPFWFDLLNKFINFRASGKKPASSTS